MARVGPARGWYVDPADARLDRFWDGRQWTARTRSGRAPVAPRRRALPDLVWLLFIVTNTWAYLGDHSRTAQLLAMAAAGAGLNVIVALWLGRRYAGRPFGWNAERQLFGQLASQSLVCVWISYCLPVVPEPPSAWTAVALWAACLPVPVWAALRRGRFTRWAPLARWQAATTLAAVPMMLALFLPLSGGAAVSLACAVPLVVACGVPWVRAAPLPSFPAADHAQPWWPRTPGWYHQDTGRPDRLWDGSRWWDDPDRDRRVRRSVAWAWTAVLIALTPLCVLIAGQANQMAVESQSTGKHSLFEEWSTGGGMEALWAILMAFTAMGTVVAWRSLDRPLSPDAAFPPAGRPAVIAEPGWLADPDDPKSWRYWDGRMWTGWTAPIRPSGGAGAPDGEPACWMVSTGAAGVPEGAPRSASEQVACDEESKRQASGGDRQPECDQPIEEHRSQC
ncbi:MAG: DUF2510 domain-containing protein [Candidatus Nanopelagicales bacterium]